MEFVSTYYPSIITKKKIVNLERLKIGQNILKMVPHLEKATLRLIFNRIITKFKEKRK